MNKQLKQNKENLTKNKTPHWHFFKKSNSYYVVQQSQVQEHTQENWKHVSTKHLHANVQSSIRYSNQNGQTIETPINWSIDEQEIRLWFTHVMKYNVSTKGMNITHATWVRHENMILTKESQIQMPHIWSCILKQISLSLTNEKIVCIQNDSLKINYDLLPVNVSFIYLLF